MKDHPKKPGKPFGKPPFRKPDFNKHAPRPAGPPKPAAPPAASPATHWGEVAEWYDDLVGEEGSEYHRHVVLPGAMRLLASKPGDSLLDIACGQGVLCRMLSRLQVHTTGVDAAADLIRIARERNTQLPPEAIKPVYHLADARDMSFVRENEFQSAACLLAMQNLHPIGPVCKAVARSLLPMGRFVIVMMHPCFRNPKATSWGWDQNPIVQYRRVDRYLLPRKIPITTHPGMSQAYTWTFHKPIEAYVKALRNAGLLVDAMEEWPSHKTSTSGPRAPAENVARKEIPMFLAIRALKVSGLAKEEGATDDEAEDVPPTTG